MSFVKGLFQSWIEKKEIHKDHQDQLSNINISSLIALFSSQQDKTMVLQFMLEIAKTGTIGSSACQAFDDLWPKVIEPLITDAKTCKDLGIMENCRLLLLQLTLNSCACAQTHKFTSKIKILKKLLKRLDSELENQDLKQIVEDVLLTVAISYMRLFCEAMESLTKRSSSRMPCWVLLSRLLKRETVPVYILLESKLFAMIVESAWKDTHPLGVKSSLSVLTILLPHLSQSVKNYYDSLFRILVNVLKWEAMFVELDVDSDYEVMAASIYCSINYFFTHLYGMMPANVVVSIKSFVAVPEIMNGIISKESNGFEPWLDPLGEKRIALFKSSGSDILTKISTRLMTLLKSHVFHPALLTYDKFQEDEEIWFKDMEPSGITVECLLLRSKALSESHDVSAPFRRSIYNNDDRGGEETVLYSKGRDTVIKDVMGTYTALCALDPYLNVFPYRNSNIKTNEEAILLIALNFEAALRVSYTSKILALKKQLFTSEIQHATYEAMKSKMEEKDLELISCNIALSTLQQEFSKSLIQQEESHRSFNTLLQTLRIENSNLKSKLDELNLLNAEKEMIIDGLTFKLNSVSSQNESIERQLKHASHQIEKSEQIDQKLSRISILLREGLINQRKEVEIRSRDSKIESLAINIASLTHDHQLLKNQYELAEKELEMVKMREKIVTQQKQDAEAKILNLEAELKRNFELQQHTMELNESKIRTIVKINQLLEAKLFVK